MKRISLLVTTGLMGLVACNKAPGAPEVSLTPDAPTTVDELVADVTEATDPNGRDEVTQVIRWTRDGEPVADLDGETTVPSDLTSKGEVWVVQVYGSDGDLNGPEATAEVTILNTAPSSAVTITPELPTGQDSLVAAASGEDVDGDTLTYTYVWEQDGQATTYTTDTVPAAATSKGEIWKVTVTSDDGEASSPDATASVVIQNSAPEVTAGGWATTDDVYEASTVWVTGALGEDTDGDAVTIKIKWFVNGTAVAGIPDDQDWLDGASFDKGDEVHAVLVPNDGEDDGEGLALSTRVVLDTPAVVTSVEVDGGHEDEALLCVVEGSDPDPADTFDVDIQWGQDGGLYTGTTTTTTFAGDTVPGSELTQGEIWNCAAAPVGTAEYTISDDQVIYGDLTLDGGSLTLSEGAYEYGDVDLQNGATLFIEGLVEIDALSFSVDATSAVDGTGLGDAAGTGAGGTGTGCGGGGGGYGGAGGDSGADSADTPGAGGAAYGTDADYEIFAGSGGGTGGSGTAAGAGGAGLWLVAEVISIDGDIWLDGDAGAGSSQSGGGGSGGGLLLWGDTVSLSGTISLMGGDGGSGTSTFNDGGGAGSGGRLKIFYGTSLSDNAEVYLTGGTGGVYGDSQHGQDGDDGTSNTDVRAWGTE